MPNVLTINRPEAKNAVDVAILTGAGDAFCAGADLKTFIL